ncbi:hypothetical protein N0V82_002575 [Gnomoniopsis sp. IMI 355080]|nr:hypothetical protein N0V82_002575 [Gnomoniopsis sp. IMI 355080]
MQDVISFPDYHCFASNQTGNTVLLSMALILPPLDGAAFSTINTAIALSLFLAGAYFTGQLSHLVGPRRRLWLILCNALQTLLVIAAAALQYVRGTAQPHSLALMAFASGSQVVQSRSLRMTEISTAMATAAWVDLVIDPRLLVVRRRGSEGGNRPRNRRLAFLVTLVAGSLVGAGILRTAGSAVALFVSAGGKAVVTGMFFFNGAEKQKQQEDAV